MYYFKTREKGCQWKRSTRPDFDVDPIREPTTLNVSDHNTLILKQLTFGHQEVKYPAGNKIAIL
jgi:hypothetical protein